MNYALSDDFAHKIYRHYMIWTCGVPAVYIEGEEGNFGKMVMRYAGIEKSWKIFIKNKDELEKRLDFAVKNFRSIINRIYYDN